jgi:epoxyqueuosine reductase
MERNAEKRIDPRNVLPNARSVVAVAVNYFADVKHSTDAATGKISRYAWGDDYHLLMSGRLLQLLERIKTIAPGVHAKIYVDTGPVMEKVWASRAGIGWQGKHTNLITKEYGSWVFLGEVLLDVELEYEEPIGDWCGTCTACIDACPTAAITEPYVVDSNKCISYLTIEHRGEIARELADNFQNWVYGCDICQDVCPWNRFQQPTQEQGFLPRAGNIAPGLEKIETITREEFELQFRRSPVKRTKREGLIRNAKALTAKR